MALYAKELKQYRVSFLVWSLTIVALMAMTMAAMPTMMANAASIGSFLKAYPEGFMRAFGFDMSSFEDPLGFYVVYSTLYVALLGSAFSISVSANILAKEQGMGTAEFLLAKPLTRVQVSQSKLLAWLTLVLSLNAVAFLGAWACLAAFSPRPFRLESLAVVSVYGLLLSVAMGGIGVFISLFAKRSRSLTGPAIGIVLGFYLLDAVAKITTSYDAYGWLSPFKWMDLKVSTPGYALAWWRVLMFALLIIASLCSSILIYRRKDILT